MLRNDNPVSTANRPLPTADCKVKLCGTASVEDALLAEHCGADYLGVVVEVDYSERSKTLAEAVAIASTVRIPVVLLAFNRPTAWVADAFRAMGAFAVQLLGQEPPHEVAALKREISGEVWKSLFLPPGDASAQISEEVVLEEMRCYADAGADKLLLDTAGFVGGKHRFGGTGTTSDWNLAARLIAASPLPTFLSGGISPTNVAEACRRVRPYGVDLCSGVESERGKRDPVRTQALFDALRQFAVGSRQKFASY